MFGWESQGHFFFDTEVMVGLPDKKFPTRFQVKQIFSDNENFFFFLGYLNDSENFFFFLI